MVQIIHTLYIFLDEDKKSKEDFNAYINGKQASNHSEDVCGICF